MTLDKLKAIASLVLLLSLTVFVVVATFYLVHIARQTQSVLGELRAASFEVKKFAADERALLTSAQFQKLQKTNLEVGAAALGTVRLINTQTIPRVNTAVDQLAAVGRQAERFTSDTNESVNMKLLPEVTKTIQDTDAAVKSASEQLNAALGQLTPEAVEVLRNLAKSSSDLNALINDPAIRQTLSEIAASSSALRESSQNIQASSESVRDTLKQFPEIAADIRKYTSTQAKATKLVIAARIISALIPILNALPRQ